MKLLHPSNIELRNGDKKMKELIALAADMTELKHRFVMNCVSSENAL